METVKGWLEKRSCHKLADLNHLQAAVLIEAIQQHLEAAKSEPAGEMTGKLEQGVEMIELSSRASNCLKVAGIRTIGELVRKSEDDLLGVKNFGQKSLDEIKEKLKEMGLDLGMKID